MAVGEHAPRNSQAVGMPMPAMSSRSLRAMRRPRLMANEPFMSGSLIRPFQPTVVRGFSK